MFAFVFPDIDSYVWAYFGYLPKEAQTLGTVKTKQNISYTISGTVSCTPESNYQDIFSVTFCGKTWLLTHQKCSAFGSFSDMKSLLKTTLDYFFFFTWSISCVRS